MKIVIFSNSSWNLLNFRKSLIEFLLKKHQVYLVCKKSKHHNKLKSKYKNLYLINDRGNNFIKSFFIQFISFKKVIKNISPNTVISFTHKSNLINILINFIYNYKSIVVVTGLGSLFMKKRYFMFNILIKFI